MIIKTNNRCCHCRSFPAVMVLGLFITFSIIAYSSVVYGQGGLPTEIVAPEDSVLFGKAMMSGGDANGDGYDDILIADTQYEDELSGGHGKIFMYSGADRSLLWSFISTLPAESDYRDGINAHFLGDINNDSCADVIIGFPGVLKHRGAVGVYSGKTGEVLAFYEGEAPDDYYMGRDVTGLGDVNNDKVGDYAYVSEYGELGTIIVRSGKDHSVISIIHQDYPRRIAYAGDINQDGSADLIIGSWESSAGNHRGISVYSGKTGHKIYEVPFPRGYEDMEFGYMLAGGTDVTGDKIPDILALSDFRSDRNRIYLISGADGSLVRDYIIPETQAGMVLRFTDMNGDGQPEVLIGSRVKIHIFEPISGKVLYSTDIHTMAGSFWGDNTATGDFNNDGADDLIPGTVFGVQYEGHPFITLLYGGSRLLLYSDDLWFDGDYAKYSVHRGYTYDFKVSGNTPQRPVHLLYSRNGADCTFVYRLGICINLGMPIQHFGKGITDQNNDAVITVEIPEYVPDGIIWLQAIDPYNELSGPVTSNVMTVVIY